MGKTTLLGNFAKSTRTEEKPTSSGGPPAAQARNKNINLATDGIMLACAPVPCSLFLTLIWGRYRYQKVECQAPKSGQIQGQINQFFLLGLCWPGITSQQATKHSRCSNYPLTMIFLQEVYYATHGFFLSNRAIYLLIFNMLESEEESQIEYWLQSINARTSNAPVVLVGTHADDKMCTKEYIDHYFNNIYAKYGNRFKSHILGSFAISNETGKVCSLSRASKLLAIQLLPRFNCRLI